MRVPVTTRPNYGTGASSTITPRFVGDIYVKTDTDTVYMSQGTDPLLDWITIAASSDMPNPMTTVGDMIYGGTTGAATRLAIGASGTILVGGATPSWSATPTITTSLTTPIVYGSPAANGDITIRGTSDATKTTSYVILQDTGGNVGIGTATPNTLLTLANNNYISAKDYAGTSYVNMFKVNASDEIDVGGTLNISGYLEGPTDGGAITVFDMPVVSALDNQEQSATFKIDGNNFFKLYSLADGAGAVDNKRVQSIVDFETQAGIYQNTTTVNAATYDLLVSDNILLVTYTATGAVTSLTLPTAQLLDGRTITIKDAGGLAGTNNITIDTEGAEDIDGADTYVINADYDSVTLISDGSNWFAI